MTTPSNRWAMLPVVLTATLLYGFDQNVVNIALPTLSAELHAGPVALELVVGGYAFAYAAGLVTGGRLGDLYGYRRVFLIGMTAFTVASLLAGLSRTPSELVGARLLQGLSAAAMVPQVLAFITSAFPAAERTTALAWFGITGGVSGILGQVLGGYLLDIDLAGLGWRALFLLNLPVGAIALALAARLLPRTAPARRATLDPIGILGLAAGVALALVPLVLGRTSHWAPWVWVMLALAVPVLALTIAYERRRPDPIVDFALFGNRTFVAGLGVAMAFLAFFASSFFVLSLFLQSGLGLNPLRAGLSFTPFAVVAMITALRVRTLTARFGPVAVIRVGCVLSGAGLALCLVVLAHPQTGWLVAALAIVGAGNGMLMTSYLGAALSDVRPEQAGVASGTLNTIQQFAGSAGLAAIGAVFFAVLGSDASHYAAATSAALWIDLGLVALIAVLAALLKPRPTPATPSAAVASAPSSPSCDQPSPATCAARPAPGR
jgi:EmrB/QacA subfamily drug resistance transporter